MILFSIRLVGFIFFALVLSLRPAAATPTSLQEYYRHKYDGWQSELYRRTVAELFAGCDAAQQQQAYEEALSFSHVTYHATASHRMENNLGLTHAYASLIRRACLRYGVPLPMAMGILSWENSGSTGAVSFAACVGLGQLSEGAVQVAHQEAAAIGLCAGLEADALGLGSILVQAVGSSTFGLARYTRHVAALMRRQEQALRRDAGTFDVELRHRTLSRAAGLRDERMLPTCNIDDSVAFMRVLLNAYDGRIDLAISTYHNGIRNTDDLLRDYLRRVDPPQASFTARDREPLYLALHDHHISYVTLWSDTRCREMLNGLRTMDGDITTEANRREALGDESDIYIWKVTAALAGFNASREQLGALLAHYAGPQEEVETVGYRPDGHLLKVGQVPVTREMAGYLQSLQQRLKVLTGKNSTLVLQAGHDGASQRGLALDAGAADRVALHALLNQDWLFDRIYLTALGGSWHVCINPRYAAEFLRDGLAVNGKH